MNANPWNDRDERCLLAGLLGLLPSLDPSQPDHQLLNEPGRRQQSWIHPTIQTK